ncbi:hypothetical protein K9K77_01490 [Candidatus Babeliales bacterium]|nr:hypothetical protein [Candidatus Babeliales bacterium]
MEQTILKRDTIHLIPYYFKPAKSDLIADVLIDLCNSNYILDKWLPNKKSLGITGNECSINKIDNNTLIFKYAEYMDDNEKFIITKKNFIKLVNDWHVAYDSKKEFVIIKLKDDKNITIIARDDPGQFASLFNQQAES